MLFDRIPDDIDRIFLKQQTAVPKFWPRFTSLPDFVGKRVLDFGCGYGAVIFEMLARGAQSCVGLDLSAPRVERAKVYAKERGLSDRAEFHTVDVRAFDAEPFDVIVSKDVFEHVDDLVGVMQALTRLLKPGGQMYIGFSPLYYSPFGDHGWCGAKIPWYHAAIGERAAVDRINARRGTAYGSLEELGLNAKTPADFRSIFDQPDLRVRSLRYNPVEGAVKKIAVQPMNILRRVPSLERYFTTGVYAVLEKQPKVFRPNIHAI